MCHLEGPGEDRELPRNIREASQGSRASCRRAEVGRGMPPEEGA